MKKHNTMARLLRFLAVLFWLAFGALASVLAVIFAGARMPDESYGAMVCTAGFLWLAVCACTDRS